MPHPTEARYFADRRVYLPKACRVVENEYYLTIDSPSTIRDNNGDSRNAQGGAVASGVYFYALEAGAFRAMKELWLLK